MKNYSLVAISKDWILLRDRSKERSAISITNSAEQVVADLWNKHLQNSPFPAKRIFYIDTCGNIDELVHEKGTFKEFYYGDAGFNLSRYK